MDFRSTDFLLVLAKCYVAFDIEIKDVNVTNS